MPHPFEAQLAHIRETLLMMSSLTTRSLALAVRSLAERDTSLAQIVEAHDDAIDRLEVVIDDLVITYMSTHGPIARDSRLMLTASKISSDLESIADQATTIARRSRALAMEPPLLTLDKIPVMAEMTQTLLGEAIAAFVEGRYELAQAVIPKDKVVDELNRQVHENLLALMMKDRANISRAVHWMTVAKSLERAADHVQNIAEEVFFLYSGQDIRHEEKA